MCDVGVLYLDDCQADYLIPIYLIVYGVDSLFMNFSKMVVSIYKRKNPDCEATGAAKFYNFFNSAVCCFLWACFIVGEL